MDTNEPGREPTDEADDDPNYRHTLTHSIVCPYCGEDDGDSWEWNNGEEGTDDCQCSHCDEVFICTRIVTIDYTTRRRP